MERLTWKDYQLSRAPTWLRTPSGGTWVRATGETKDGYEEHLHDAIRARFVTETSASIVNLIGAERGLPRSPSDTDATYAARVHGAWRTWPWAGTPYGVLQALWDAGYGSHPVLVTKRGWSYRLNENRELVSERNVSGDFALDQTGHWNVYGVVFPLPLPAQWAGGVPTSSSLEARSVIATLRKWAPAYARLARVVVITSGGIWGFPFSDTWGSGTWGGTTTVWTT